MSRKNWWELLTQKKDEGTKPFKYIPASERYKRPDPTFDTPEETIQGRTRGIGTEEIPQPISGRVGARTFERTALPEPIEPGETFVPSVPKGWYAESKFIDAIQTFNLSLLNAGYSSKKFFFDTLTKAINIPVTEDVEVGGRYGIKKAIPMDKANIQRAKTIEAGNKVVEVTNKAYDDLLLRHPEWVPRIEYQGSLIENVKRNPLLLLDPGYLSQVAGESLGFSLAAMTIGATATVASGGSPVVGLGAMFCIMYPQEAQQMKETLMEHGMEEDEAVKTALWTGAIITSFESASDMYILTKMMPALNKTIAKTATKSAIKVFTQPKNLSAIKVGAIDFLKVQGEEITTEIFQALTEDLAIRIVDKTHEVLPDASEIAARTFIATAGFATVGGVRGGVTQYRKNIFEKAMEADKIKGSDPIVRKQVDDMLRAVQKVEEEKAKVEGKAPEELDVSGTTEQVEQADITYTGEEIGDVGIPKVEPTLDESLFTKEEQELYSEQRPKEDLVKEEDRLRETLKTEIKSLKNFEKEKKAMESLYKKYVWAKRNELNKQRNTPKDDVDAIVLGRTKMRTPVSAKTDWIESIGAGNYARIFDTNPNLSTPDAVAADLQIPMSEDQLRQEIAERLKYRRDNPAYTFETAEKMIDDPAITGMKVKIETMSDMIDVLKEEVIAGEKQVAPTKEQQTKLEGLLEEDPRFEKAAEALYQKPVDKLSRQEVETVIMQLEKAGKILTETKGFKRPTFIGKLLTPHIVYSEVLGVKPIVTKAEKGKQEQDIEYRNTSNIAGRVISGLNKGVTTIGQRFEAFKRNKPTPIEEKMAEALNKYEIAPKDFSERETVVFNYLDNLRRTLLKRQNEVRAKIGIPLIKGKKAYFKHVIDVMAEAAMLKYGLLDTQTTNPVDFRDFPFPEEIIRFIEKKVAAGIHNPAVIRRKLSDELTALWNKDLRVVTNAMLWTALKEIHLAEPIKGLVESLDALRTVPGAVPADTLRWLTDYVNQVIKGQENELDVSVNNILNESGLKGFLDKLLAPYGRRLGPKPLTRLLAGTGKLIIYAVMGPIPRQILRNTFQTLQNIALYGVRATVKGIFSAPKECKDLMKESIYYKGYTGLEEIPEGFLGKLGDLWLKGYQLSAVWNAGNAMKAAYHYNMSKIRGKYQHTEYSWADKDRNADTPEGFLFDSEKEKLLKEMEWGARSTQYQYTPLGMPGIFRYKAGIPFTRLQSWWMNYFFNFTREASTRMFKGTNGYGVKLPPSERLNYAKYLLIGGVILSGLGYEKSFGFGVMPMYLAPGAAVSMALYKYTFARNDYEKEKALEQLKRGYQALIPGYLGVKTWAKVLNGDMSMEELFFYTKTEKPKSLVTTGAYKSAKERYSRTQYKSARERYNR